MAKAKAGTACENSLGQRPVASLSVPGLKTDGVHPPTSAEDSTWRLKGHPDHVKLFAQYTTETTEYNKFFGATTGGNWCACYELATGKASESPSSCGQNTHHSKLPSYMQWCPEGDGEPFGARLESGKKVKWFEGKYTRKGSCETELYSPTYRKDTTYLPKGRYSGK